MEKKTALRLQLIFVAAVLLLQAMASYPESGFFPAGVIIKHSLVEVSFKLFFFFTAFYFFPVRVFIKKRFVMFSALYFIFICLINLLFTYLFIHFKYPSEEMPAIFSGSFRTNYFDLITFDFAYAILGSLSGVTLEWYKRSRKQDEIAMQNLIDELSLVQSKINPDFLFSTLDNINFLITDNSAQASDSVIKLSHVMWYMLYDAGLKSAPLQEEVELINDYVELQKLNAENPISIQFKNEADLPGISLPPLTFFPIVEETLRYCKSLGSRPSVNIEIFSGINHIFFSFTGSYTADNTKELNKPINILKDVRKRLKLLFENKFKLDILQYENEFSVKLDINYT